MSLACLSPSDEGGEDFTAEVLFSNTIRYNYYCTCNNASYYLDQRLQRKPTTTSTREITSCCLHPLTAS